MKLLSEQADFSVLCEEYGNMNFHMFCSDHSTQFISCIACVCERSEDIVENWQTIQNFISVYHQPSVNLAAWNVYLAFVTSSSVPVWEKYLIENNKFVARKIILDEYTGVPSPEQLVIELEKQLLGSDLMLNQRVDESIESVLSLREHFRGAPLDSKIESKERRALIINHLIEIFNQNEN
ncbi:ABC-three component system middle component 1 [Acinetobacter oleivorans]|uniref:ABC-three component system middle component 1 n=1 Tax=Acinetobacter oleivorans TaxID=1148157 RepID=UPI00124FCE7C|nr:ABC-three component system middle component 1 [Acinetobacter oleivorans]